MLNYLKLRTMIRMSALSLSDIENLTIFFEKIPDQELKLIIELIEEKPDWLRKLNKIIKLKTQAKKEKNEKLWSEIIKKEIIELKKIEN